MNNHLLTATLDSPPRQQGVVLAGDATLRSASGLVQREVDQVANLLKQLFSSFNGSLAFRLWNGDTFRLGQCCEKESDPSFTLVCHHPGVIRSMIFGRDPLRFAEAYFRNHIDFEGDFFAVLALRNDLKSIRLSFLDRIGALITALRLRGLDNPSDGLASDDLPAHGRLVRAHSKSENRCAISFHYDVSNEFYGLWLDKERVYSCAYFTSPDESLDQAQCNKLEHICRKLRLRPGERLLDIGCGWGALIFWAARYHGVHAHGVTLSRQQFDYAQHRIQTEGLQDLVTVELLDYRDLAGQGSFDKVSSIGMFEYVGLANLPTYLATVARMLRPGGLFLNHGITHDEEGWQKSVSTEFINRYVFPDGELDCVSNIQLGMERAGFEIHDVEGLRPHYALTLRHWVKRLEANREAALCEVDEATYRVWRLYMAACALDFESGSTGIYQILASKPNSGEWPVPLARGGLYDCRDTYGFGSKGAS
jgi:cyclopropane-fatty-acyl-phospholipid synthase